MSVVPHPLPPHLAERTRALNARACDPRGEFVLYWMHHAVRDHENAALDVARHLAVSLGRPLLVYQGLGGRHRFNSDRHHAFILDGAREVAGALAARGIRHVFHLPLRDDAPGPLRGLIERAAAVVCEDYPAPPFPRWTAAHAARAGCAVLAVDAFCIVPMALAPRRFDRAFAFRDALLREFEARVDLPWPPAADAARFAGQVGFEPVDWSRFDRDAAIAACAIDHALPPVADTPGGSAAGYVRWARFRDHGLRHYARLRNDAAVEPPLGVSRLSPYLHHGHVAATRIAREAHAVGGPGADKFLDELFVWRELAFNWCRHTPDPERLEVLPAWARETLARHAGDLRPVVHPADALDSGRTGEPLWDLAQRSLLRHGELHNNLRMTWGKAILPWSRDPAQVLARLVDLNHRHALDGNDPASYGGLLWCLGLFDRPFAPDRPVTGTIRPRPLDAHAARLDVTAYARRVSRANGRFLSVAVIGAGIAGAAAARTLADQGHRVVVFDKSRGVGGRMATRRTECGPFDHGAPAFTAVDPRFRRRVAAWVEARVLACSPEPSLCADGGWSADGADVYWRGEPDQPAVARRLLEGIALLCGKPIVRVRRGPGGWRLHDADATHQGPFDALVVAVPAPQAIPLLDDLPTLAARLEAACHRPCWSLLLTLSRPWGSMPPRPPAPLLALVPGRPRAGSAARLVAHASLEWSTAHLEDSAEAVREALLEPALAAIGLGRETVVEAIVHRWRHARVARPVGAEALFDPDAWAAVVGDSIRGDGVESAFLSGVAGAGYLMRAATGADPGGMIAYPARPLPIHREMA
jgi:photolyase PhrII